MNDISHADALDWLAAQEPGAATAIVFDPPYAVGSPIRGREHPMSTAPQASLQEELGRHTALYAQVR